MVEDELFQDLFRISSNWKNVEKGNILIAAPFFENNYFSRAVIYMVGNDGKGSMGVILNKLTDYRTSDLLSELKGIDFPVYFGGAVEQNKLYYLHVHSELKDAQPLGNGIYWGGDLGHLRQLLKAGEIQPGEIRFFAGYSKWGAGHLRRELDANFWMVGSMEFRQFFDTPTDKLWEKSMKGLGGKYKIWANFPENPSMN